MSAQDTTNADLSKLETFFAAAQQHGDDSDGDHEIGDLKTYFRTAFNLLTEDQKAKFIADSAVRECLELGGVDLPQLPVREPLGVGDTVQRGKWGKLLTKSGVEITGSNECVFGTAGITRAKRRENGTLEIDYDGGTDMDWNSSKTTTDPFGFKEYVTEDGEIVSESELVIVSEEDEDETND